MPGKPLRFFSRGQQEQQTAKDSTPAEPVRAPSTEEAIKSTTAGPALPQPRLATRLANRAVGAPANGAPPQRVPSPANGIGLELLPSPNGPALLTTLRAIKAAGIDIGTMQAVWQGPGGKGQPQQPKPPTDPALCNCDDCAAALSPRAYLVDLLDFTVKRIMDGNTLITLQSLMAMLQQPFSDLIASCDMDTPVRQVRICIEVLRIILGQTVVDDSVYRQAAYLVLLDQAGVAYEELRLSHTSGADQRKALADRLGIDLDGNRPDHLDALLFDLAQSSQPTEQDLSTLFGLADTHSVQLTPAPSPSILTWRVAHLRTVWAAEPATGAPIIDPDLIDSRDFNNPTLADPAYTLWQDRATALSATESTWRAQVGNQPGNIDGLLQSVLGVPPSTLDTLASQRADGADVVSQLTALNLETGSFDRLMALRAYIEGGLSVLASEWDEFYDILLQVWKRQQFATWQAQEAAQHLLLSPDVFQIPPATPSGMPEPPFVFTPWRATPTRRRAWQDILRAHIDQDAAARAAVFAAIDNAEGETLATLRDVLLMATDVADTELATKAQKFTAHYLIDAQMSTFDKTTRVAQAIATLQDLVFAVRTGQFLGQSMLQIEPSSETTLDEEWQWMGSYAAWRAQMRVFLYPENILTPTLRRPDRQTPSYASLIDQLRENPGLTPSKALQVAQDYAQYLGNVTQLSVEASCMVSTPASASGQTSEDTTALDRMLLYLFARAPGGQVYFSTYDRTDVSGFGQTFWRAVPGLGVVEQILGAVPYLRNDEQQEILLFVRVRKQGLNSLVFLLYDLLSGQWADSSSELSLPGRGDVFTAAVGQRNSNLDQPVTVVIAMPANIGQKDQSGKAIVGGTTVLFENLVNVDATGWAWPDFQLLLNDATPSGDVAAVLSLVTEDTGYYGGSATWTGTRTIFFQDKTGLRMGYEEFDDFASKWHTHPLGAGALQWCGVFQHQFALYAYVRDANGTITAKSIFPDEAPYVQDIPSYPGSSQLVHLAVHCGEDATRQDDKKLVAFQDATSGPFSATFAYDGTARTYGVVDALSAAPVYPNVPLDLTPQTSESALQTRAAALKPIFSDAVGDPPTNMVYLKEAYFFVPILLALQLQQSAQYTAALDWFRSVYDFNTQSAKRLIYTGFALEKSLALGFADFANWLEDPDNPHALAETRQGCYLRFTLLALVRCFLEDADTEFTRDTAESLERARLLYLTAVALLDEPALHQEFPQCPNIIGTVVVGTPDAFVNQVLIPGVSQTFCVPLNPMLQALRAYAEVNLFKLRQCRNIAGLQRPLSPYDVPADIQSALPAIGISGTVALPGATVSPPTPYRYTTLIDRAKLLAGQAQQFETSYLSALEKADVEAYSLLKARQDMRLASASVRLQDLRVTEAQDGVTLASMQQQQHQDQADHYAALIQEDLSDQEKAALAFQIDGVVHLHTAATISEIETFGLGGIGDVGQALLATSSLLQTTASYERRRQEWQFQQTMALDELRSAGQQIVLAQDQVRVVGQERAIAQLQSDNAQASVDFLAGKFTNVDLYEWMSGVLGGVYRYFLQQASSTALAALNQLAFERQEVPPPFIQSDYWDASSTEAATDGTGSAPDRRGLTGAARLLEDIAQLDQYAFQTNQRKLQLSKTISLAQMTPAELQRFRQSGVITFATPMDLFDHDFPGHYLRLIRRVRISVVALVPPAQGIRATLSNPGVSRVVISDSYRTVIVRRDPQLVALSAPLDATGIFELDVQPELLLPFEGLGVDTTWEFRMPRAANFFDFNTIADVLIALDYTALDSYDYRLRLLQSPAFTAPSSADRPFSFRYQFADQWYDLHNPEQTNSPMVVRFSTARSDFPPNLDSLQIQQVLLYFASTTDAPVEFRPALLTFIPQGGSSVGGSESTVNGIISTRGGNGSSWIAMIGKLPIGDWVLDLSGSPQSAQYFKQDEVSDILLVITYTGQPPDWPA